MVHFNEYLLHSSTETANKRLCLQMGRMEMDNNLKKLGVTQFQVVSARLQKIAIYSRCLISLPKLMLHLPLDVQR